MNPSEIAVSPDSESDKKRNRGVILTQAGMANPVQVLHKSVPLKTGPRFPHTSQRRWSLFDPHIERNKDNDVEKRYKHQKLTKKKPDMKIEQ